MKLGHRIEYRALREINPEAARVAWEATDRLCSKGLHPFLPELVEVLRRHGDKTMTAEMDCR